MSAANAAAGTPHPKARVLVVDDEPGVLESIAGVLTDEGYATITASNGVDGLELFDTERPDMVLLDIWLPDRDGLEVLRALRERDPEARVVMISGHGTVSTAVKAIKMGAQHYLEKPVSYEQLVETVEATLADEGDDGAPVDEGADRRSRIQTEMTPPPTLSLVKSGRKHQRTIRQSTVIYGLGLHSGKRTGMVLQPLPPNSGLHFLTLPSETLIAGHVGSVADTSYATTLSRHGESIKTVEHLLSALHAYGVTNLLVKVHGEVPVLDGSALEFCKVLEEAGVEGQRTARKELVVDREIIVGEGEKQLKLEPYDGFRVSYQMRYPPPIGEQFFDFDLDSPERYKLEIAPARTFGFVKDAQMIAELGLGSGGPARQPHLGR